MFSNHCFCLRLSPRECKDFPDYSEHGWSSQIFNSHIKSLVCLREILSPGLLSDSFPLIREKPCVTKCVSLAENLRREGLGELPKQLPHQSLRARPSQSVLELETCRGMTVMRMHVNRLVVTENWIHILSD